MYIYISPFVGSLIAMTAIASVIVCALLWVPL